MAAANGIREVIIGQHGLMSTPAVSAMIRKLNEEVKDSCVGGVLLTASHNPGGIDNDFGIKFNTKNGGPAPESITDKIFKETLTIRSYKKAKIPEINLNEIKIHDFSSVKGFEHKFRVSVIDSCDNYIELMKTIFDFEELKAFVHRKDFGLCFDGMHGVSGPYAKRIFVDCLGLKESDLMRCNVLEDFGGGHPDPNLTYAD